MQVASYRLVSFLRYHDIEVIWLVSYLSGMIFGMM